MIDSSYMLMNIFNYYYMLVELRKGSCWSIISFWSLNMWREVTVVHDCIKITKASYNVLTNLA